MNGGGFKPSLAAKIAAFIKRSRQNTAVRRITNVMAVFVVFITTYMMILPAITLESSAALTGTSGITIDTVTSTGDVTYDGTNFETYLTVNFHVSVDEIKNNNYVATYYLPEGVTPPSAYTAGTKIYDSDATEVEYYYYATDGNGNWYIYIQFIQSEVDKKENDLTGEFSFQATISGDYYSEGSGLQVDFSDSVTLTITNITFPEYDNGGADITVSKTAAAYDSDTNSITYTVTVSSSKGTDSNITLSDLITSLPSGVAISTVTVDSVVYYDYDSSGSAGTGSTTLGVASGTNVTSGTYYATEYTSQDGMTITLPEIYGTKDSNSEYGGEYVITYTVSFDEMNTNVSENVANTATASADSGTITNSATAYAKVTHTILAKSGTASEDGTTITWTITVNAAGDDITGYTLSDDMLADVAYNDIVITMNGNVVSEGQYFSVDSTTHAITFLGTENTGTYVITYTTSSGLGLGGSGNVTNNASLTDSSGDPVSVSRTVGISGAGGISKTVDESSVVDNGDGTKTISWTSTLTIPSGGISAGTYIYDVLSNTSDGDSHYFTYAQVIEFLIGSSQYAYNLPLVYGTSNDTIGSGYYTIEFYDYSSGTWVTANDLTQVYYNNSNSVVGSTYENTKFTQYRIYFENGYSGNAGTITLTYSTTIDTTNLDGKNTQSITYSNKFYTGSLEASASHEETKYENVVKTDGSGSSDDSDVTTTDGTVTWIIKVLIPASGAAESYTVTDTLPDEVSLNALYLSENSANVGSCLYDADAGTTSGTFNGQTIDVTVSGQTVTLTIPEAAYPSSNEDVYLYITCVCTINDTTLSDMISSGTVVSLKNSVTVTYGSGNTEYGTDTQTQTVTYEEEQKSVIAKAASFDDRYNYYSYSVLINPEAADLVAGADTLTFTDELTTVESLSIYFANYAQLLQDTVQFYELTELAATGNADEYTDGTNTYVYDSDNPGNLYKYEDTVYLKTATDIAWQFTETKVEQGGGVYYYHYIITAEIPDSTRLLVEYTYELELYDPYDLYTAFGSQYIKVLDKVSNTASLSGVANASDSVDETVYYYDYKFDFTIYGYALYKVDSSNYGQTLEGAEFTIYKYVGNNAGVDEWESTGITVTTNSSGTLDTHITQALLGSWYTANTAYYFVETKAPDGYVLDDSTRYYFYWSDSTVTTENYPDGFTSDQMSDGSVYNLSYATQTVYIANIAKTYVEVEKVWKDQNGSTITENLPESVTVDLYYYTTTSETTTADEKASKISAGEVTRVASGITLNSDNDWTAKVTSSDSGDALLTYSEATGLYYHYYFVETAVDGTAVGSLGNSYSLSYTTADGTDNAVAAGTTNAGKVTITNTVERAYAEISVDKKWAYSGSSKTVAESAKQEVTLLLLRSSNGGSTVELVSEVALDGTVDAVETSAWQAAWSDLLYSYTEPNGSKITYTYYICEICDDSSVSIAYTAGTDSTNAITYNATVTDPQGNETTVACTAYAIALSEDNTNNYSGKVTVTNTIPEPEKKSVTTEKIWQDYDGNAVDPPEDAEVTLQLYMSSGTEDGPAGGTFTESGTYVSGDTSGYVVTLKYDSQSGSYTLVVPVTGESDKELSATSNTYTFTDTAGDSITLTLDGGSVTWSGMDGAYDYYVVETSAKSGGIELSAGEDGYTTYYSADGGTTTGTNAADYAGMADETVSNAAGTENGYTVINRANSGTTELTVNKVFTGGTETATAVYIQLWQVAEVTVTTASGEVTASTSTVQVTETSYGTNTTQGGVFYYMLSDSNSWSMDFSDLPSGSRVTDTNGTVTETVYSYYVVETGASTSSTQDTCSNLDSYEVSYTAEDGSVVTETVTFDADGDGTDETAYLVESSGVTITNADAYAILAIEKEWQYPDGTEADAGTTDSATIELWREASYKVYTGTYYTINVYYDTVLKATKLVPANTAVTITIPSSGLSGYHVYRGDDPSISWSSTLIRNWGNTVPIELTADEVTNNINVYYWGTDGTCTITYENEDNDSGITVRTVLEKIDEETLNSTNAWTYNWQLETEGTINVGSMTYDCTYTYYLTETSAAFGDKTLADMTVQVTDSSGTALSATKVTDSSGTMVTDAYAVTLGTTLTTVTATNQVPKEEEQTTSVSVTKTWASSIQEASVTFTLIQLLVNPNSTSDSDKWITDSGDKVVVNASGTDIDEYTKTKDVTNSADVTATWSDLPTKATYNGESYECAYFIAETKVTNGTGGTGTDITDNYEAAYKYSNQITSGLTTYTADSIVYYQVTADDPLTVTNTAQESVILPMTGGLGADRMIVSLGCGLALLAVCIFFVRRRILCGGGDCET